ncbi:uncharacterized protein FA14DRAFT_161557 [Meira miltonrushii]|uniref:Symplekin n=1 Tax=Meira miltonrushii TaxID=1280837 RepID=A0A316V8Y3_9BASI|nr:uncharacterized protein FA14DRAFT_161557 [Meira miltonrushii]PWN33950.1 hypothetical protein FA14DRAFT_161557 [Meira miltonrushii]
MADSTQQGQQPDALALLGAALQAQDAKTEERNLRQLFTLFQSQPGNIPPLFPSLLSILHKASPSLKKWIVEVIDLTFCKPTLGPQARSSLAYHMPEPILALLNEMDSQYAKVAITAFASVYQPLFRLICTDPTQARLWHTVEAIKQRIVQMFEMPHHLGIKLAAVKAFQKIILVQTRASDSRGHVNSRSAADANLAHIPPDHAVLRAGALEQEANERLTQIVTIIFTSSIADLVMASMNCLSSLAKLRPSLSPIVFEALISWSPSALSGSPYMTVRSVEKTLKLLYQHFHPNRNSLAGAYASQIIEAVDNQKMRMETAAREEEARKAREASLRKRGITSEENEDPNSPAAQRKHVRFTGSEAENSEQSTPVPFADPTANAQNSVVGAMNQIQDASSQGDPMLLADPEAVNRNPMASFDASTLPLPLVVELILANLGSIEEAKLEQVIAEARARINGQPKSTFGRPAAPGPPPGPPPSRPPSSVKKEEEDATEEVPLEAQDPLKLDMGEEETMEAAERQLQEATAEDGDAGTMVNLNSSTFALKAPVELKVEDRIALLNASVERICQVGVREAAIRTNASENAEDVTTMEVAAGGNQLPHAQLWTVLITRLATRGLDEHADSSEESKEEKRVSLKQQSDAVRELMLQFILEDFAHRVEFALQWIAEEFHCILLLKKKGILVEEGESSYSVWLQKITATVIEKMDSKDKTLYEFLSRIPQLTDSVIATIQSLCLDKTKMAAGFTMLRDLAIHRVPARTMICSYLLGLARNVEKMVRGAAIITVRNWVRANGQGKSPAGDVLENDVLQFAKAGLKRLTVKNQPVSNGDSNAGQNGHANEDSTKAAEESATAEAEEQQSVLDDPNAEIQTDDDVLRLVELPFALCVRVPEMLDEVFNAYAEMPSQVQKAVETHIKPLVQNLGSNNSKLLHLIQHHPPAADSLAVIVFGILGSKQRSKKMVDMVKQMAEENANEIDPRFLIPILPDLEKAEIIKYLPRVVSILSSDKQEDRLMLKNVFTSVVQPPEQGFGSVSTNLPRVRQSELLSPVELMSLLHHAEPEIGRKTAADAIRLCFGMTDIFRSEVIGAVLNLLIEEPVLPVLFMRTAIIAVRTYKSLSSYISTIFLSRLITKKVWQQPLLWEGFIICAKQTAPASFSALIQLPREQLRDVVEKQPDLRVGLRDYLIKKAGGNKARKKNFLELLGENVDEDAVGDSSNPGTPNIGTPGSGTSTPIHVNHAN